MCKFCLLVCCCAIVYIYVYILLYMNYLLMKWDEPFPEKGWRNLTLMFSGKNCFYLLFFCAVCWIYLHNTKTDDIIHAIYINVSYIGIYMYDDCKIWYPSIFLYILYNTYILFLLAQTRYIAMIIHFNTLHSKTFYRCYYLFAVRCYMNNIIL